MGLRNPSRLSIDPKTDVPYTAWVGPDAGAPSVTQGPSTYENAAQITRAGNYGWPYCMGNKQAYRDRPVDANLRTDSPAGYVPGGPATGGTEGWYDCDNLRNDSPNNTGLVAFPHQTGTGADAGKVRGNNLWYSRGNPGSNNGCPDFPRPRGANTAPDYSATPTQLCPYAQDNGMTIMDGPVYRYDKDAADQSKRWPEYWDGRWFLHNNGGASIKHGLMLDPATAGHRRPADLRRLAARHAVVERVLHGLQVRHRRRALRPDLRRLLPRGSERRHLPLRLHRRRADAERGAARACRSATSASASRRGSSGGVSYEWEFGDGATSTEANPTHKYPEAKRYTAKLTVTYGDGGKDSNTIDVDVLAAGRRDRADHDRGLQPGPAGQRRHLHAAGHAHADGDRRRRRLGRRHHRVPRQRRRVPDLLRADHPLAAGRLHDRLPLGRQDRQRRDGQDGDLQDRGPGQLRTRTSMTSSTGRRWIRSGRSCAATRRTAISTTAGCGSRSATAT